MIKSKVSLTSKIIFSFITLIIISIFISVAISNSFLDSQFNRYLDLQQDVKIENLQELIQEIYKSGDIKESTQQLKNYAESEDLFVNITDTYGKLIFTTDKENLWIKNNMGMHQPKMYKQRNQRFEDAIEDIIYEEDNYSIVIDDKIVANLTIGYLDAFKYTEQVGIFKTAMMRSFIIAGIIVILLAIILSYFISKSLSKPIVNVTQIAHKIKDGDYRIKADESSSTKEIYDLSKSINFLGESLEKDKTLREKLTSDLVHEIKTPLTIINNFLDAFIDGIWTPDEDKLNSCKEEVQRLSNMTNKLKDIYLLESAQMHLKKVDFDISEYINHIISVFLPMYNNKYICVEKEIEDSIIVHLDKDKVKQIMYNLLSNALRYTDGNGKVKIKLSKIKEKIRICVEDNGMGISEQDLPYIFERFYRADESRSRESGGAGIGLSITKGLVEAQDGSISVESEKGKGSKFIVEFIVSM